MADRSPRRSLTVDVTLRPQKGVEAPKARAYLFDRDEALVDSKLVGGGQLKLQLADDRRHRLVVGPDIAVAERSHGDVPAELARSGAISRDILPGAGLGAVTLKIPPSIYRCWWQTCIYVHGSVRKQTAPGVYAPISVASEVGSSNSPPAPENPLVREASDLLHGCTNGAFAVNLYTEATATDGYARQSQYDRSASIAFALLNP